MHLVGYLYEDYHGAQSLERKERHVTEWWLKFFDSTAQSTAYHQFYPQTFHIIKCLHFYTVI